MKRLLIIGFLFIIIFGCEKSSNRNDNQYVAKIVGFDLNCSTCILTFPNDSLNLKSIIGESRNNYYQTVNLSKDEFHIGQLIKAKVRKADDDEPKACITLYPSFDYKDIFVLEYECFENILFNDTIDLAYGECMYDSEKQVSVCFDSVLTDSRCPENLVCIWAGVAIVRFKFDMFNDESILINLYTGTIDTIINGYDFSFIDLHPYPNTETQLELEDYIARIIIKQQ